jgi:hypothetical protein
LLLPKLARLPAPACCCSASLPPPVQVCIAAQTREEGVHSAEMFPGLWMLLLPLRSESSSSCLVEYFEAGRG